MSARVLVVDDLPANVRLLAAKLHSEYFEVLTAHNGAEAIKAAQEQSPDIILLDVMMPGMDGFTVCREIKANPATNHIPVVMVTALSDTQDRVKGLDAGADDFLTKPPNDVILFARIRSLVRLKRAGDEWRTRESTMLSFGGKPNGEGESDADISGRVMLVIDDSETSSVIERILSEEGHDVTVVRDCAEAAKLALDNDFHLVLTDDIVFGQDAVRLCSQLRSQERSRHWPILLMINDSDIDRIVKALEIGVSDYLMRPVVRDELIARSRSQIRRRWYEEGLRASYAESLTAAVTDSLTGLNNRRFLEAHFEELTSRMSASSIPISIMLLDLDRFKAVNDTHGHGVGDVLLKQVADRIQSLIRSPDTAVRLGGEEFVVLMPNTPEAAAIAATERLCAKLGGEPYDVSNGVEPLSMTVSIGVATVEAGALGLEDLLSKVDAALYKAKSAGRNRFVVASDAESSDEDAPVQNDQRAAN